MRKIFAFLSAIGFLSTSTLSVVACGTGDGALITINIKDAPEKAKDGQDPLSQYVYNDTYQYDETSVKIVIATAAQLTVDKIKDDAGVNYNSDIWKDFYTSPEWTDGNFSSFNYEVSGENAFSFKANNGEDLYGGVKNNDLSVDTNKIRLYWFITSSSAGGSPTKDNISIPKVSEFKDTDTKITKEGWVHFFLTIGTFKIDLNAHMIFTFIKYVDKNNNSVVLLQKDTATYPFGVIDADNPKPVFSTRIADVEISKTS